MSVFRVEQIGNYRVLCGGILSDKRIKVGQKWIADRAHIVTIKKIDALAEWITYVWTENGKEKTHTKMLFPFQCRYSLILNEGENAGDFD